MTTSEKEIAKYAAQIYQHRKLDSLTEEEQELAKRLVKHGYLTTPSNGFLGRMTNKAMIHEATDIRLLPLAA